MNVKANFFNHLIKLTEVKSILSFAAIGTLCALAFRQNVQVSSEMFAAVVSSIVTYFFTKPATKNAQVIEDLPMLKPSQDDKE